VARPAAKVHSNVIGTKSVIEQKNPLNWEPIRTGKKTGPKKMVNQKHINYSKFKEKHKHAYASM